MKNLCKKLLACCLALCMVLTLCVGALTVSAEVTDNYVKVGSVEVTTEETAVVPVSILSTGGIAAAEINVSVPNLTISKLELVTTDANVEVTFASAADPTGAPILLDDVAPSSEVAPNIIDNVFTYIVHLPANTVTTAEVTLNITFAALAVGTYDITVDTESCKDATSDLLTLTEVDGAIVVTEAHTHNYVGAVTKEATCTETGVMTYTCTCGEGTYTEEIPVIPHTEETIPAVDATCTTAGSTAGVKCSVCDTVITAPEAIEATGHAWDEGVIDPDATCTDEGVKTYTCATCGETKTEAVSAKGHTPVSYEDVEATCTTVGYTGGTYCEVCGAVIEAQTEVPALGHTYVDGTCSVCGAADPDYVAPVVCEHANKVLVEATPASSEQPGLLDYDCPDCDDDDSIDITVIYKSDLTTFVTPAISCEATTILRLKTAKTTNFSTYTDGLLVTTHNYQNGATSTTDYYNMSEVPVVSSRYQLDVPVIYTQFTDTFDCAMYVESGDIWYSNGATTYSLKDVAMMYINADSTAAANRYAAANLLKVGAAAQTEFDYAKNNLADNELDDCEFVENEVPTISNQSGVNYTDLPSDYTTAGKVFYVTPGVVLNDSIAITLKANKAYYNGGELDNLRLEYVYTKENGTQVPGEITKFETDSKGRFLFTLGVDAPDMRSVITFSLYNGDVKVADDAVYSIEGAMAAYYNAGSYTTLIERVMIYSDVVAKYF